MPISRTREENASAQRRQGPLSFGFVFTRLVLVILSRLCASALISVATCCGLIRLILGRRPTTSSSTATALYLSPSTIFSNLVIDPSVKVIDAPLDICRSFWIAGDFFSDANPVFLTWNRVTFCNVRGLNSAHGTYPTIGCFDRLAVAL